MRHVHKLVIVLLVGVTLVACAPGPRSAAGPGAEDETPRAPAERGRTVVMLTRLEPDALTPAMGRGLGMDHTIRLVNAGLALRDGREAPHPYLAEALPQLNTESWQVFPDGRMQTTYRLRSGLEWHDGTPLTGADFVFAWRVYTTPEFGVAGAPPQNQMEEVAAPDTQSIVIRWHRPYPKAGTLGQEKEGFLPLPRHVLQDDARPDQAEAFSNHPYWTREYVGLGPYRLNRWESGSFLEGAAFGGHALGRPTIDRIQVSFVDDPNTALASLLAGAADLADTSPLRFQQALILQGEWAPTNGGTVLFAGDNIRFTQLQLKPEVADPQAMMDARIRRALAHAIDKQALNDGLFEGQGVMTDSLVSPHSEHFPAVERAITRNAYDLRRTEQLMIEAGLTRAADGFYASPAAGKFSPVAWVSSSAQNQQEVAIMVDGWRQAGIDAGSHTIPPVALTDYELRSTFPAMFSTGGSADDTSLRYLSTAQIPGPANLWRGGLNFGGYSNSEYDRLITAFETTLEREERSQQVAQMMKLMSEDVPWIPLYFNLRPLPFVSALSGPQVGAPGATDLWNVHEWQVR